MDNDPTLMTEKPTHEQSIYKPNHIPKTNKKQEKLYSHIEDTIKATETRLKLDLPPSYIKLKVILPLKLLKHYKIIKNLCTNFFKINNTTYLQILNSKLREIESKLINNNKSHNSSDKRKNLNLKEWIQISKLDPKKTPLILFNRQINNPKISIKFFQPKHYSKNILNSFRTSKSSLINNFKTKTLNIEASSKNLIMNSQNFTIYTPSEYISMIIPWNNPYNKLPTYVIDTLNKGLNYTPHTNTYPIKSIEEEFNTFKYKLLWQDFFSKRPVVKPTYILPPSKLNKKRIKHNPPKNDNLTNFCDNLERIITHEIKNTPKNKPTIETINFYKTRLFFKTNPQYVVKPADKGSSIIIMHQDFYMHLGLDFLNKNITSYKILTIDPLNKYNRKINLIIRQLLQNKMISKKLEHIIKPNNQLKTPNLYFLPKVHKIPNISGRPICSGNSHPAENISIYLDYILKPYVTENPIYLKDSPQLLNILNNINGIPEYALIFSLDVINMYPSIPLYDLINSINKTLESNPDLLKLNKFPTSPETILTLLKTVLFTNYSHFNGKFYKQIHGVAMGTPCACTITDIFMCNFVLEHFFKWTYQPRLYKQYRDDSFGLWLHGEATLLQYLEHLNSLHPTIKFTLTYGKEIQFLDLTLNLTNTGTIKTETYYKSTDTFQYLEAFSCHPPAITKNIPKSQLLRHVRNCSTTSSFLKHAAILRYNLLKRSYPNALINRAMHNLSKENRGQILKIRGKKESKRTPLIVTYNSNLPNLNKLIRNNLPTTLQQTPPLLAYRIKRTIGSYLIKAKFNNKHNINN